MCLRFLQQHYRGAEGHVMFFFANKLIKYH